MTELCLESTTARLERMRIPSLTMADSAKEIAITFCFIGLMAGSLCVGFIDGQTLNQQEQGKVPTASTRRRLLPQLSRIHHPALPAQKQNFLPSYSPSLSAPKESYHAPPATPTSKESYALPGPPVATQNQGEVDIGENQDIRSPVLEHGIVKHMQHRDPNIKIEPFDEEWSQELL